jgi:Fe-S-cluster containining protein
MKDTETMECRRCGICCTIHQAFVVPEDIEHITSYLGITRDEWMREYDDPMWRYSQYNLIRHVGGACAFLRYEDGLATCTIQPVKPKCCRDWEPGPDRKECRAGLEKAGDKR